VWERSDVMREEEKRENMCNIIGDERERDEQDYVVVSASEQVVKWGGLLQHNMACCCSSLMILMRKEERAISVNGVIWCKHSRDT